MNLPPQSKPIFATPMAARTTAAPTTGETVAKEVRPVFNSFQENIHVILDMPAPHAYGIPAPEVLIASEAAPPFFLGDNLHHELGSGVEDDKRRRPFEKSSYRGARVFQMMQEPETNDNRRMRDEIFQSIF